MTKKKVGSSRSKLPFWKKLDPELKHVSDHLGKMLDNSNVGQLIDALLYGSAAYFGFKAFGFNGLMVGPIALKLAMAENIVPATSGVVTLALIGAANTSPVQDAITALTDPNQVLVDGVLYPKDQVIPATISPEPPWAFVCPEGYTLKRGPSAVFCVLTPV